MSVPAVSASTEPGYPLARLRASRRLPLSLGKLEPEAVWLWVAVLTFVLVSLVWLLLDDRVPDWDSGFHMGAAIAYHYDIVNGHITAPFTDYDLYAPLVHLLGAASIFIFGIHPMAMIMSSNIVFVPLLAFGCYGTGRLVAGPRAGLLAGVFALGTPMFVSMMHEYDLDPPQAALIAMSVWAILASRRFERVWISALAGALLGLAMLAKQTSLVFVAGLILVVLVRGGWRSWRGLFAFVFCLENVAGPWYIYHARQLVNTFNSIGQLAPNAVQAPPRFSTANAFWYFWNLLNEQTLTLFAALFFIGVAIAIWRCIRERITPDNVYPELLGGAFVSYLGMTYLTHKDPRYTLPALVYVAVLGTSWIVQIRRPLVRQILTGAVVALAAVYLAGMSFGIGGAVRIALPGARTTIIYPRQLTLYETAGWVRGGAATDGHVLLLLEGLSQSGVRRMMLDTGANELDFNANGLVALATTANIYVGPVPPVGIDNAYMFVHVRRPGDPPPCQTLNDGTGIYVARGNFAGLDAPTLRNPANPRQSYLFVCPGRAPLLWRPQQ